MSLIMEHDLRTPNIARRGSSLHKTKMVKMEWELVMYLTAVSVGLTAVM